ncbi:uncharacterized protein BDV14DRAFT_42367 [Aspergillus stella-maris]|uniref:uncharacterized protein n=1 Tax=Aspergillus stella-maris TaxID=1810926 RepID=UPI003CCDCE2A
MSSTTLMTFLLCTPPQVRSVKLLGSWDNFSKQYVMERDQRVGAGHWRGCHTFTNITCDGSANNAAPARNGGLKMGGTYWYYYLLDDDVEYYNKAEPMTTHCPFLPGQPVNVLQVPVILPDTKAASRARSPSVQNTMNPDDKYMNPREPPKPGLRLRTSPPQLLTPQPNGYFSTSPLGTITIRGNSQPNTGAPKIKHPRNEEKPARSVSPPRSKGLRAAFRQWNGSTPSLSSASEHDKGMEFLASVNKALRAQRDERLHVRSQSNDSYLPSPSIGAAPVFPTRPDLPLRRRASAEGSNLASLTIQERRALTAKAADDSTPKNPLTLKPKQPWGVPPSGSGYFAQAPFMRRPLSTPSTPSMLRRPNDCSSTPVADPATPTPQGVMNKRLPTLPNSPSSVMDEALRDLDEQEKALDMEALGSHFSDFTDIESTDNETIAEKSRFSEWSTDNDMFSPESMTSVSTFGEKRDCPTIPESELLGLSNSCIDQGPSDPNTPHLTDDSKPSPAFSEQEPSPHIDAPPRLTITSSPFDLNIPGLCIDDEEEEDNDLLESNPKRHAAFFKATELKGLGLTSPPATSLRFPEDARDYMSSGDRAITPTNDPSRYSMFLSQSATMKEMLDELSYLKNMIQSGAVPPEI